MDYVLDEVESSDIPQVVEVISADDSSCPVFDSCVPIEDVLIAGPLHGVLGFGVLARNGLLTFMTLPPPGRAPNRKTVVLTNRKMVGFTTRFNPEDDEAIERLLWAISQGEDELDDKNLSAHVLSSILSKVILSFFLL